MSIDPNNNSADSFVMDRSSSRTNKLPLTTIDKMVRELGLKRIDFIKMDIEGSEREALTGAIETIRKHRPRMAISSYHLSDDPAVIQARVNLLRNDYQRKFGRCLYTPTGIVPEICFYF